MGKENTPQPLEDPLPEQQESQFFEQSGPPRLAENLATLHGFPEYWQFSARVDLGELTTDIEIDLASQVHTQLKERRRKDILVIGHPASGKSTILGELRNHYNNYFLYLGSLQQVSERSWEKHGELPARNLGLLPENPLEILNEEQLIYSTTFLTPEVYASTLSHELTMIELPANGAIEEIDYSTQMTEGEEKTVQTRKVKGRKLGTPLLLDFCRREGFFSSTLMPIQYDPYLICMVGSPRMFITTSVRREAMKTAATLQEAQERAEMLGMQIPDQQAWEKFYNESASLEQILNIYSNSNTLVEALRKQGEIRTYQETSDFIDKNNYLLEEIKQTASEFKIDPEFVRKLMIQALGDGALMEAVTMQAMVPPTNMIVIFQNPSIDRLQFPITNNSLALVHQVIEKIDRRLFLLAA